MSSTLSRRRPRTLLITLLTLGLIATVGAIAIPSFASAPDLRLGGVGAEAGTPSDDGAFPGGVSVHDNTAGVTNLDPALLEAVQRAAADAEADGIDVVITSGWRSPEYQDQLLRDAVADYGTEEEAARWVATSETSAHVSGDAVDIGYTDAMYWFARFGDAYGLCQIYDNEPWHYELRPAAVTEGCAPMYSDPTEDPRMQR